MHCQGAEIHHHVQVRPQHLHVPVPMFGSQGHPAAVPVPLHSLQIDNKTDKVWTLQLKPCSDLTVLLARPRARDGLIVGFPPLGAVAARRVHFALPHTREPRRELFPPGQRPGGYSCLATIPAPKAARQHVTSRAPNRLDLQP